MSTQPSSTTKKPPSGTNRLKPSSAPIVAEYRLLELGIDLHWKWHRSKILGDVRGFAVEDAQAEAERTQHNRQRDEPARRAA